MIRAQVQFTEAQMRQLRRVARAQGVSVAEVVRRLVDRGLEDELPKRAALYERARAVVGAFKDRDDAADVSERHDDYLERSFR